MAKCYSLSESASHTVSIVRLVVVDGSVLETRVSSEHAPLPSSLIRIKGFREAKPPLALAAEGASVSLATVLEEAILPLANVVLLTPALS